MRLAPTERHFSIVIQDLPAHSGTTQSGLELLGRELFHLHRGEHVSLVGSRIIIKPLAFTKRMYQRGDTCISIISMTRVRCI